MAEDGERVAANGRIGPEIRVVLVDDHLAFRQPLAFMLMREPDIAIIGQAGSIAEARPLLSAADIVLLDLDLPDGEGVALLHELRVVNPQAIALVLTGNGTNVAMARAVEAGAAGVLHKARPVGERPVLCSPRATHSTTPGRSWPRPIRPCSALSVCRSGEPPRVDRGTDSSRDHFRRPWHPPSPLRRRSPRRSAPTRTWCYSALTRYITSIET